MEKKDPFEDQTSEIQELDAVSPKPLPIPFPITPPASGLYEWSKIILLPYLTPNPDGPVPGPNPNPISEPIPLPKPLPFPWKPPKGKRLRAELRLDVDGRYPQMVASGTVFGSLSTQVHWIANLTVNGRNSWTGNIWYKDGAITFFLYTNVQIQVIRSWFADQRSATVTFSGGGSSNKTVTFKYKSPYFHPVNFEFDCAEGESATTTVATCAHPNRPATLPCENLTIQRVYQRAGFDVTTLPGGPVPLAGAGANARWSDQEMHDAMQIYWSRFASTAQWAMWIFFASLHESGTNLGGVMFDDIGPNHRQGTSIFNDSFISNPPAGDPNPTAWIQRMIFWTACHEMGHSFNLAHSWQKQHPLSWGTPWIPLANEPEARSFMNYPYNVSGGQTAFFADFQYRFTDQELLFMRHAPTRFVQMGNADWFDHHGFEGANVSPEPTLRLELRVNRERAMFEFMEPVTLEMKLTNTTLNPQLVDENLLSLSDSMTVILKKDGRPTRQLLPYARYCRLEGKKVLMPGESIYESLFVSAGRNGWDIAEPGNYTVQVALNIGDEDIVSNPLRVRVLPPQGYDEEILAQDFFGDDIGRIVSFDGSRFFSKGNDTLREIAGKLSKRKVALHASLALGTVLTCDYKELAEDKKEPRKKIGIKIQKAEVEEARKLLSAALTANPAATIESFGHIDFKWYTDRFSDWLAQQGAREDAVKSQDILCQVMSTRQIHGRKILEQVLQEIKERRDSYKNKK